VGAELIISPQKVESYYQQHKDDFKMEDRIKLRTIVINKSKNDPEASRRMGNEVIAKIKDGVPFAEMASIYSSGSQRAQGGDWNWVERSVLRKDVVDAAFALNTNQVSSLVETPDDFWIMLVEDKQPAHVRDLKEVRDDVEKVLVTQEKNRLQRKWIDRLRKKAFIRYF
jgi:parvulin-like peptidyl-prolyl isomerase